MTELVTAGQRFGKLVTIEEIPKPPGSRRKRALWLCRCDCGNECEAFDAKLLKGEKKSCGCLRPPKNPRLKKPVDRNAYGKIKCLYPSNSCPEGKPCLCCRECGKYEECEYRCKNEPERCGSKKAMEAAKKAEEGEEWETRQPISPRWARGIIRLTRGN